jgi:hypothetical protein
MLNNNEVGALEFLQTIPSGVLSQFVKGEVDINKLLKLELSYRGQDSDGKWIGFNDAAKHHHISV